MLCLRKSLKWRSVRSATSQACSANSPGKPNSSESSFCGVMNVYMWKDGLCHIRGDLAQSASLQADDLSELAPWLEVSMIN